MFTWVSSLQTRLFAKENVWAEHMALCQLTAHLVSSFTFFLLCVTPFPIWRASSNQWEVHYPLIWCWREYATACALTHGLCIPTERTNKVEKWRHLIESVCLLFSQAPCVMIMGLPYFLHESRHDFLSSDSYNLLSHCKTLTLLHYSNSILYKWFKKKNRLCMLAMNC